MYINHKDYPSKNHCAWPCYSMYTRKSPLPLAHSRANGRKDKLPPLIASGHMVSMCRALSLFPYRVPVFSHLSRRLHGSKTLAHSCIRNALLKNTNPCPKPKHTPESKAHFRSHKRARSEKLSDQQRKYHGGVPGGVSWFSRGSERGCAEGLL